MSWKKLKSPTKATLNENFQFSFCELGKKTEVSLRRHSKIPILNLGMN